jgi:hypothetical protein
MQYEKLDRTIKEEDHKAVEMVLLDRMLSVLALRKPVLIYHIQDRHQKMGVG